MDKQKEDLGTGYVADACKAVGLSNTLYYTGKKKLEKGLRLTKGEIKVLAKHKELVEAAKKELESLKG